MLAIDEFGNANPFPRSRAGKDSIGNTNATTINSGADNSILAIAAIVISDDSDWDNVVSSNASDSAADSGITNGTADVKRSNCHDALNASKNSINASREVARNRDAGAKFTGDGEYAAAEREPICTAGGTASTADGPLWNGGIIRAEKS